MARCSATSSGSACCASSRGRQTPPRGRAGVTVRSSFIASWTPPGSSSFCLSAGYRRRWCRLGTAAAGSFPRTTSRRLPRSRLTAHRALSPFAQRLRTHAPRCALLASMLDPNLGSPSRLCYGSSARRSATTPIEWLDAAIVLVGDGAAFPPVLGSGGNDGRYDVANNYAQALVFALAVGGDERARRERSAALAEALWRMPAPLRAMSLAHLARDASPVNSPAGESDALGNPWQLALAIEGTLLLAAGAGRRLQDGASPGLVAPFTLRPTGAGYGSAVAGEKGRAELWLPVWDAPATLGEIEMLFREASPAGRSARRPVPASMVPAPQRSSASRVASGRSSGSRSSSAPGSRTSRSQPGASRCASARRRARCARSTHGWAGSSATRAATSRTPSARRSGTGACRVRRRPARDAGRCTRAAGRARTDRGRFSLAREPSRPKGIEPISPLAEPWLAALDTASSRSASRSASRRSPIGSGRAPARERLPALRDYLHATGLDERGRRRYGRRHAGTVPLSAGAVDRLAAAHARRHQDAARTDRADLGFDRGIGVALADLSALMSGQVDERELGALIDGLALLDFAACTVFPPRVTRGKRRPAARDPCARVPRSPSGPRPR